MAKKVKTKKNILNEEIVIKKSLKQMLINDLITSIIIMIIIYICFVNYNNLIVDIFSKITEEKMAIEIIKLLFPIILIVKAIITLGHFIILKNK